jgi:hypothetical protein
MFFDNMPPNMFFQEMIIDIYDQDQRKKSDNQENQIFTFKRSMGMMVVFVIMSDFTFGMLGRNRKAVHKRMVMS